MPANEKNQLTKITQEGLVAILCYDDSPKGAKFVRGLVPTEVFDPQWRDIVESAVDYIDRYGRPPGDQTAHLIEACAARAPAKKRGDYAGLFESLKETKEGLHRDYFLDRALAFARWQRLDIGITSALDGLEKQTTEGVEEAEKAILEAVRFSTELFDAGTHFTDRKALSFLTSEDDVVWPTPVRVLNHYGIGAGVGRLLLFCAPPKHGKSWWLINLAKRVSLAGIPVLYITLEMSERLVLKRLFQSFFSISKRQMLDLKRVRFSSDAGEDREVGRFVDFEEVTMGKRPSFADPNIAKRLRNLQLRFRHRARIVVKQFPTGELTLKGMEAYLDGLAATRFFPRLVIVDYADLMKINPRYIREETQEIYRGIRGMGVRRKLGMATASQGNRDSLKTNETDTKHLAEDIGKAAICDALITYSRSDEERELGLARLLVAGGREDADRMRILVSQKYDVGQFCLDSVLMSKAYEKRMETEESNGDES